MSDWQKAVDWLGDQGYECIWKSPDCYETVWRKGDVDVSLDEISDKADITVPLSDLPSVLSSMTLDDVETAVEQIKQECMDANSGLSEQALSGALYALGALVTRLRLRAKEGRQ